MRTLYCKYCDQTKPVECFNLKRNKSRCLACVKTYQTEYQKNNPGKISSYNKKYNNSEKGKKTRGQWNKENPDRRKSIAARYASSPKGREANQRWSDQNPDKRKKIAREWARRNAESRVAYRRQWYSENLEKYRDYTNKRRASLTDAVYDAEVTRASLRERDGDFCAYCGVALEFNTSDWHTYNPRHVVVEHITPLVRGGSHTFDNTCLSCRRCNASKHTRKFLWDYLPDYEK